MRPSSSSEIGQASKVESLSMIKFSPRASADSAGEFKICLSCLWGAPTERCGHRLRGPEDWLILTAFESLASSQREKSDAQARHHAGFKCGDGGSRDAALASPCGESWRWRHQVRDQELYADH